VGENEFLVVPGRGRRRASPAAATCTAPRLRRPPGPVAPWRAAVDGCPAPDSHEPNLWLLWLGLLFPWASRTDTPLACGRPTSIRTFSRTQMCGRHRVLFLSALGLARFCLSAAFCLEFNSLQDRHATGVAASIRTLSRTQIRTRGAAPPRLPSCASPGRSK
jgi:hypothetical protein